VTRPPVRDLTRLLRAHDAGDEDALNELLNACRADLRRIARSLLRNERPHHTLQPTALVNEAYLRLFDGRSETWADSTTFFAAVAREMRRTLTDHARRRLAQKRGGHERPLPLSTVAEPVTSVDPLTVLALDAALERLAADHPRAASVVELRYITGLSVQEIAALLNVTRRTVERDWLFARAQLYGELAGEERA
jgi:RNA polymerase sigma factor (TIGR02999 family)